MQICQKKFKIINLNDPIKIGSVKKKNKQMKDEKKIVKNTKKKQNRTFRS